MKICKTCVSYDTTQTSPECGCGYCNKSKKVPFLVHDEYSCSSHKEKKQK